MDAVRAFNNELSSLYENRPPVSRAKMAQVTKCAIKAIKFYKHVVQSVEKFIQKCKPEYKVPGLYVIDSIVRQSRHQFGPEKDVFAPRFTKNIVTTFSHLFKCPTEERSRIVRVLNLWQKNSVFPMEVNQALLDLAADPNNPDLINAATKSVEAVVSVTQKVPLPGTHSSSNGGPDSSNNQLMQQTEMLSTITKLLQQAQDGSISANAPEAQLHQLQQLQQQLVMQTERISKPHQEASAPIDSNLLAQIQTLTNQLLNKTGGDGSGDALKGRPAEPLFNKKLLDFDYGDSDDDDGDHGHHHHHPHQQMGHNRPLPGMMVPPGMMQENNLMQQIQQMSQQQEELQSDMGAQEQLRRRLLEQQQQQFDREIGQAAMMGNYQDRDDRRGRDNSQEDDQDNRDSRDRSDRRRRRSRSRSPRRRGGRRSRSRSREKRRRSRSKERHRRSRSRDRESSRRDREKERERKKNGIPPLKDGHISVCTTTLWFGHLTKHTTEEELREHIEKYGTIKTINMIPPRGCAFVCLTKRRDAFKALDRLKGVKVNGNSLKVAWAPGIGVKESVFKDRWDVDLGVTYIPWGQLPMNIAPLLGGGMVDEESLPDRLKGFVTAEDDEEGQQIQQPMQQQQQHPPPQPMGMMQPGMDGGMNQGMPNQMEPPPNNNMMNPQMAMGGMPPNFQGQQGPMGMMGHGPGNPMGMMNRPPMGMQGGHMDGPQMRQMGDMPGGMGGLGMGQMRPGQMNMGMRGPMMGGDGNHMGGQGMRMDGPPGMRMNSPRGAGPPFQMQMNAGPMGRFPRMPGDMRAHFFNNNNNNMNDNMDNQNMGDQDMRGGMAERKEWPPDDEVNAEDEQDEDQPMDSDERIMPPMQQPGQPNFPPGLAANIRAALSGPFGPSGPVGALLASISRPQSPGGGAMQAMLPLRMMSQGPPQPMLATGGGFALGPGGSVRLPQLAMGVRPGMVPPHLLPQSSAAGLPPVAVSLNGSVVGGPPPTALQVSSSIPISLNSDIPLPDTDRPPSRDSESPRGLLGGPRPGGPISMIPVQPSRPPPQSGAPILGRGFAPMTIRPRGGPGLLGLRPGAQTGGFRFGGGGPGNRPMMAGFGAMERPPFGNRFGAPLRPPVGFLDQDEREDRDERRLPRLDDTDEHPGSGDGGMGDKDERRMGQDENPQREGDERSKRVRPSRWSDAPAEVEDQPPPSMPEPQPLMQLSLPPPQQSLPPQQHSPPPQQQSPPPEQQSPPPQQQSPLPQQQSPAPQEEQPVEEIPSPDDSGPVEEAPPPAAMSSSPPPVPSPEADISGPSPTTDFLPVQEEAPPEEPPMTEPEAPMVEAPISEAPPSPDAPIEAAMSEEAPVESIGSSECDPPVVDNSESFDPPPQEVAMETPVVEDSVVEEEEENDTNVDPEPEPEQQEEEAE